MSSSPIPTARTWTEFFVTPVIEKHRPERSRKSQRPAPIARIDHSGSVLGNAIRLRRTYKIRQHDRFDFETKLKYEHSALGDMVFNCEHYGLREARR